MIKYRRNLGAFIFAFIAFIVNQISQNYPEKVLQYYSHTINRVTIQSLSRLFGIFPFSVFEILIYILFTTLVAYLLFSIFKCIRKDQSALKVLAKMFLNIASVGAILYGAFIFLWGLNYNRPPLATEFNLEVIERRPEELLALGKLLTDKTNTSRELVLEDHHKIFTAGQSHGEIVNRAAVGFEALAYQYPFFSGDYGRVKGVLASPLMSYTFITGIYSPFTGEPNVNVSVPDTTLLFTASHEIAHQRGIAPENDANFVAFLACIYHPDSDFQYSGYFNALNYTRAAIRRMNPNLLRELNGLLTQEVVNDINNEVDFWLPFQGPVEAKFQQINETYLRANGVTEGTQSYGLVVDLLLAFYQEELHEYIKK